MLDLTKLFRDIDNLGREKAASVSAFQEELQTATRVISNVSDDLDSARSRIESARTSWLTADFEEDPTRTFELPAPPPQHAVIATDGSQIVGDKHEITLCYVINTSSITLYYGTGDRPSAVAHPKLCYKDEDVTESFNNQQIRVNETIIGLRRTMAEANEMERAIAVAAKKGVPTVGLWDGSLIFWSLQNEPEDFKKKALDEYLRAFDVARENHIPIAGYISDPGSRDFINSMKIMLCDEGIVDCDKCTRRKLGEPVPCDQIARLTDSTIYNQMLRDGQRSVLFTSKSKILKSYKDHSIFAFYMNAGKEIVRVEVPEWVARDQELLNLTHAVCYDQAMKGKGYPVALAEAHEHAVIRGPERRAFYEAVERSFIKHGARIGRSLKRISKGY